MLKSKCYTHMPHLPRVSEATANKCMTAEYLPPKQPVGSELLPQAYTYNPELNDTQFIKDLQDKFGKVECMCMSFSPHTLYDWHTDIFVKVRINYVLNDVGSTLTLFKEQVDGTRLIFNIDQCKYTIGSATLFNPQITHCVINNSDQTRYLLSIRFFETDINYGQVEEFLLDYISEEVL